MLKVILLILLLATSTLAGDYQETISINAVGVSVVAKDEHGRMVKDLQPGEITVLENGVRQSIIDIWNPSRFQTNKLSGKDVPLSVTFAIDTSSSMNSIHMSQKRLDIAKNAILMLMDALKEEDQMMLVPFGRFPKIATPMTQDRDLVENLLLLQRPKDNRTAIFDSLSLVLDKMELFQGRKILVLCTDGEDNASKIKFETFLEKLGASDVWCSPLQSRQNRNSKGTTPSKKWHTLRVGMLSSPLQPMN
jgi:VWFA-related protein